MAELDRPQGPRQPAPPRTARAGLLSLGGTGVQMLIQLVSLAVLSRLLAPQDFGLYAMAMTFVGFSTLFKDLGLGAAAVQAKEIDLQLRSNLFWVNSAVGAMLTLLMIAAAPLVGWTFQQPEVTVIVLLMSPTLLLAGMSVQYGASLMRDMRFGLISAINIAGGLVGLACSVTIALVWGGYWALALPQVISGTFSFVCLVSACRWLPVRFRRGSGMRPLLRFGAGMFGAQVLTYLHRNMDTFLIGRVFGAVWTGSFNRAAQVSKMPMNMLAGPFTQLALAKMSRHQDDPEALSRLMRQGQILLVYPLLLASGALIVAADQIVLIVLGPGWDTVAVFLRLIVLVEACNLMPSIGGWLVSARGQGRMLVYMAGLSLVLKAVGMIVGLPWGPYGVIAGSAAAMLILWPSTMLWCGWATGISTVRALLESYRVFIMMAVLTAVGWAVTNLLLPGVGPILQVLLGGLAMIGAGCVFLILPATRADLRLILGTVKSAR